MADSYSISIQPSGVSITRLADNTALFSTNYNYLNYDPTGAIKFPVSPTMSGINGNLTWQFNGLQVVVHNSAAYAAGAITYNTYMIPMQALNPTVTADNFADVQVSNIESPYSVV